MIERVVDKQVVRHEAVALSVSFSEDRAAKVTTFDNSNRFNIQYLLRHEVMAQFNLRDEAEVDQLINLLRRSKEAWDDADEAE